jgi:hypothetical protein
MVALSNYRATVAARPTYVPSLCVVRAHGESDSKRREEGRGVGGAAAVEMEKKVVVKSEECRGWHTVD